MAEHIDLVKNEWGAGFQVRLVTVENSPDRGLGIVNVTPGWEDLLSRPLSDGTGEAIYPFKESPVDAMASLVAFYRSDYVFATAAHSDDECPFRNGPVLAMKPAEGAEWGTQLLAR